MPAGSPPPSPPHAETLPHLQLEPQLHQVVHDRHRPVLACSAAWHEARKRGTLAAAWRAQAHCCRGGCGRQHGGGGSMHACSPGCCSCPHPSRQLEPQGPIHPPHPYTHTQACTSASAAPTWVEVVALAVRKHAHAAAVRQLFVFSRRAVPTRLCLPGHAGCVKQEWRRVRGAPRLHLHRA